MANAKLTKEVAALQAAAAAGMDIQTDNGGQIVIYTDLMYNPDAKKQRTQPYVRYVESDEDES